MLRRGAGLLSPTSAIRNLTFTANPLCRASQLRKDEASLKALLLSPSSRLLPLHKLQVAVRPPGTGNTGLTLAWHTADSLIDTGVLPASTAADPPLEAGTGAGAEEKVHPVSHLPWAFLGLLSGPSDDTASAAEGKGLPCFAVSLPESPQPTEAAKASGVKFLELRTVMGLLPIEEAAIAGQARAIMEWRSTHRFCGVCGAPTVPCEGGIKVRCSNRPMEHTGASRDVHQRGLTTGVDAGSKDKGKGCGRCVYPRTDPVAIALVVNKAGTHALLGRKASFPPGVFTCPAGFLEAGESIEEAVRREIREETGVQVGRVDYFASQPWPFLGGQLMCGCHAVAEVEDIKHEDDELEDARWFTREEVRAGIEIAAAAEAARAARKEPADLIPPGLKPAIITSNTADSGIPMRLPPPYAIAHHLAKAWVDGTKVL